MIDRKLAAWPEVHVNSAWQARIKTADGSQNVDSLEMFGVIFFEEGRVLNRVLVRPGNSVGITRAGVPTRWWIRMIICDFAVTDDNMMREHTAHGLMEAAPDGVAGHAVFGGRL